MQRKQLIYVISVLSILVVICFVIIGNETKRTIAETYPGMWRECNEDIQNSLFTTLAANKIGSCGQLLIKSKIDDKDEYLVACTSDGINWNYYIVWPRLNKVVGPLSNPIRNENNDLETIKQPIL